MLRAFAVFVAVSVAGFAPHPDPDPGTFGERQGCGHVHRSVVAYERIRLLVRHTRPTVDKRRVQHYATCVATRAKAHRAHQVARAGWAWRHRSPQVFRILLLRDYAWTLGWLASTRSCESGGNYGAISKPNPPGKYRGAYQFDFGTWGEVGGSGDPAAAHPWEQDYRAAVLYVRAGPGRWPVCGH